MDVVALLFLIAIGALGGFLSGLLGIGSGLILVPAISYWLHLTQFQSDHTMHIALATCFAVMVPTGVVSILSHKKHNNIVWQAVHLLGPWQLIGIVGGTILADHFSSDTLTIIFAVGILVLAALIVRPLPAVFVKSSLPRWYVGAPFSMGIGFFSSLIGIGGATMNVPFLTFHGVTLRQAIGTASALGLLISLPAVIMYMILGLDSDWSLPLVGYFHTLLWLVLAPMSMIMAPVGARYTQTLPLHRIRLIFAGFMVFVSIMLLVNAS